MAGPDFGMENQMKKNPLVFWLPVAALLATAAATSSAPDKIGFVDSGAILENTEGFAEARSGFEGEIESRQRELQQLNQRLETAVRQFEDDQARLSPSMRQERVSELRRLQQQLQTKAGEMDEWAAERERELLGPFQRKVQRAIDKLRAERGLAVVLERGAEAGAVLSSDPGLDITAAVIAEVN